MAEILVSVLDLLAVVGPVENCIKSFATALAIALATVLVASVPAILVCTFIPQGNEEEL